MSLATAAFVASAPRWVAGWLHRARYRERGVKVLAVLVQREWLCVPRLVEPVRQPRPCGRAGTHSAHHQTG